ncbi:MAG: GNAT family N-acetyltransferase [Actinomycetia bacterium]|nr:GNAT family N-acetyltransferase [Actinomycetes bacterium]MCP3910068.1 GNAT family N-acetyltransferase [Actinomycetes bacterium]MCP4085272.1 GNAT family N-acetyltransferase [Actinomycetes bacterium]
MADGTAVLGGPGLFVNRALAAGIDEDVSAAQLADFEEQCRRVGVPPAVEVTEVTRPSLIELLGSRGYQADDQTSVMVRDLAVPSAAPTLDPSLTIEPVEDQTLGEWREATAVALELTDPAVRRASDAFARAAHEVDDPGLFLARRHGQPIGSATLKIRDGMATLGGMSTVSAQRRRGVQTALVFHRLDAARAAGCSLAVSSAEAAGDSERNLLRLGFRRLYTKKSWTRSTGSR